MRACAGLGGRNCCVAAAVRRSSVVQAPQGSSGQLATPQPCCLRACPHGCAWCVQDMEASEIGALLRHPAAGAQIAGCVASFPHLHLEAHLHPITRTVLRIELAVTPAFSWRDRRAHPQGAGAEPVSCASCCVASFANQPANTAQGHECLGAPPHTPPTLSLQRARRRGALAGVGGGFRQRAHLPLWWVVGGGCGTGCVVDWKGEGSLTHGCVAPRRRPPRPAVRHRDFHAHQTHGARGAPAPGFHRTALRASASSVLRAGGGGHGERMRMQLNRRACPSWRCKRGGCAREPARPRSTPHSPPLPPPSVVGRRVAAHPELQEPHPARAPPAPHWCARGDVARGPCCLLVACVRGAQQATPSTNYPLVPPPSHRAAGAGPAAQERAGQPVVRDPVPLLPLQPHPDAGEQACVLSVWVGGRCDECRLAGDQSMHPATPRPSHPRAPPPSPPPPGLPRTVPHRRERAPGCPHRQRQDHLCRAGNAALLHGAPGAKGARLVWGGAACMWLALELGAPAP